MNYNFFADRADKLAILELVFQETDLQLFELSSKWGQTVQQYDDVGKINSEYHLLAEQSKPCHFQLWSPAAGGKVTLRKIELDPKLCQGHTFRYATEGWGLIQLYFGGVNSNILSMSHIGHWSEKRALLEESYRPGATAVSDWDWREIERVSRKLKSFVHRKLAVRTMGSMGVLSAAQNFVEAGGSLRSSL